MHTMTSIKKKRYLQTKINSLVFVFKKMNIVSNYANKIMVYYMKDKWIEKNFSPFEEIIYVCNFGKQVIFYSTFEEHDSLSDCLTFGLNLNHKKNIKKNKKKINI
jgi:hypothetical protein